MNSFISDSLNESSAEALKTQEELKAKDKIIKDNNQIIVALRAQVQDYQVEIEELERNEQVLKRDISKIKKELEEKNEELEAVSHAKEEVETANENLNRRYNARIEQLKKYVENLAEAKAQVEELTQLNEQLTTQNNHLTAQLNTKDLALKRQKRDEDESKSEELQELRNQVASLKQQLFEESQKLRVQQLEHSERMESLKKSIAKNTAVYRFPTADEVGEFMDPSSAINNTSSYRDTKPMRAQRPVETAKPPVPKAESFIITDDPVAEEKMRLERVKELARRNKLTKPLHQTSYALELETFDEHAREVDIKRGNIRRQPLTDQSNQRKPIAVKKPEFFVV